MFRFVGKLHGNCDNAIIRAVLQNDHFYINYSGIFKILSLYKDETVIAPTSSLLSTVSLSSYIRLATDFCQWSSTLQ